MLKYTKNFIKDFDEFDINKYPDLSEDLNQISNRTADLPHVFKAEILISFAKTHSLKTEWIMANPKFVALVTSGVLPIANMESLFEASSKHFFFQQQLEQYLTRRFQAG